MNLADDLQKLQALREQGALTEEEFVLAKKRVFDAAEAELRPKPQRPNQPASALKALRRSDVDRWIGGVSGGLGEATGIPSWTWRILFILTALVHGIGLLVYILLWIFVPLEKVATIASVPTPRE